MSADEICITGVGVACSLSDDWDNYCDALLAGESGIEAITHFDVTSRKTRIGATMNTLPQPKMMIGQKVHLLSGLSRTALYCYEQAALMSGLHESNINQNRVGVIVGSGFSNLYDLESTYKKFYTEDARRISPLTIPVNMGNAPAGAICMAGGHRGIARQTNTACASGLSAIHEAKQLLDCDQQDMVVAGGVDLLLCETILTCWENMRILSDRNETPRLAHQPFDKNRRGIVLGDGAAFFVLEKRSHATSRNAKILGVVKGSFQNNDASDLVKPKMDIESHCISATLANAGLSPEQIDGIHCHGTGTIQNDIGEYGALKDNFDKRLKKIPLFAIKSMIGHTMGASGPLSLAAALKSLSMGYVYPHPSLETRDPAFDINLPLEGYTGGKMKNILVNAFGFGGVNCCVAIGASEV